MPTPVGGSDVLLGPSFAFASLAFLLVFVELFLLRSFGRAATDDAALSESQNRNEYKFSVAAALGLAIAVVEAVTLVNMATAGTSSTLGLSESSWYNNPNEMRVPINCMVVLVVLRGSGPGVCLLTWSTATEFR